LSEIRTNSDKPLWNVSWLPWHEDCCASRETFYNGDVVETENLTERVLQQIQAELVRMNARFEAMDAKIDAKIDGLRAEMNQRFDGVGRRFDQMNRQMLAIEARLSTEISAVRANVLELEMRQNPA
jgi:hypothetical protein